ncbi:MAG: HAMP domain-containing histidine kinase [Proteobacteria bacterium]|nr:HAMP domain-containing histidine kinase [Pseudomonadota bacterium]
MINLKPLLQFKQQILATILLVYHILVWSTPDPKLQLALSFILYGLFLLWQPLWDKDTQIKRLPAALGLGLFFLTLTFFSPKEALLFFGLILLGLFGSRLLSQAGFRSFDLLALVIVTLEMAVGLIPDTFAQIELPIQFADYMQTIILIPVLLFFFAPNPSQNLPAGSQVDLMHGLLATTLIFIVLLGGIVINLLYHVDYLDGLLLTVFIVSTLTIGISWIWNPGVGYSGIGVLWNRYAMTIGGPFETWINTLTTLIEEHFLTPKEYLEAASDHLVENNWLNGIQWNFENHNILSGEKKGILLAHSMASETSVDLYFKSNPGAALEHHTILLIRMAYQFYLAKLNQEKMRAQEHIATIHHTGARLTHDIRNILQSVKTSLDILNMGQDQDKRQKLLQTNLLQISGRLENTLNKLRVPKLNTQIILSDCEQWMDKLEEQHQSSPKIVFHRDIEHNVPVPIDLFDSVADNLINNAIRKSSAKRVDIRLLSQANILMLSVCDDGSVVKESIEESLFKQPVSSGAGMGIGLYQSSIMARAFNFELELSENEPGKVCFSLFQHQADLTG